MRILLFGILGVLIQGAGLGAFILVSRSSIAGFGKPAIVVVTGLAICALLWEGVRRSKRIFTVCLLPITLALGYVLAFHLLGLLGFPGLLSDAWPPWLDYALAVVRVTGYLLVLYGVATVLFFAINRGFRRFRMHVDQQSPNLS
jgi:hypothetical protein